jgi:DNA-binding IclR family transcriptional regulator
MPRAGTKAAVILEALESGPKTIQQLMRRCGLTYKQASSGCYYLRDFKLAKRVASGKYQIIRKAKGDK